MATKWDRQRLDKLKKPKHSLMKMLKKDSPLRLHLFLRMSSTTHEGLHDV